VKSAPNHVCVTRNFDARPWAARIPTPVFFSTSALFHYLGPSFAVLLFASIAPLGVAWLRVVTAALVFAAWRRPWRVFVKLEWSERRLVVALGFVLAAMNMCFYLAIARLPLATVGAIEFVGPVALAAVGVRGARNASALALAIGGVALLTQARLVGAPLGYILAFANAALFVLYVIIGHRLADSGGMNGIDRLGAAMIVAAAVAAPFGLTAAVPALGSLLLLLAAIGVGVSSSVIPYVADQCAMARLPRSTFSLMLSLLPAIATVIGIIVLGQIPSLPELGGIGLVIAGVAIHRPETGSVRVSQSENP
jgi:inner membrane transporter RhtA